METHGSETACRGYYTSLEEAEAEVQRLKGFFYDVDFYIFVSLSRREPPICTL